MNQAVLALEDGTVFEGNSFGAPKDSVGEVVFNTAITGYQEIFTDPSYSGQIVVLTNPANRKLRRQLDTTRKPSVPTSKAWSCANFLPSRATGDPRKTLSSFWPKTEFPWQPKSTPAPWSVTCARAA